MSVEVREVAWDEPVAVGLREALTAEVGPRYADRPPEPAEMGVRADEVVWAAVAFRGERGVGHIALRWAREEGALEVKRMYVTPDERGHGIGRLLLVAAEDAARAAGARRVVLQTGDRQPDAAALYEKTGYARVPIFPPYTDLWYSLCFAKEVARPGG